MILWFPSQSFLVCQYKVQQHTSPQWLLHHPYQNIPSVLCWNLLGSCVPTWAVFPAEVRAEAPREHQSLWGSFQLTGEFLIDFPSWQGGLQQTPTAVSPTLSLNSYPWALALFFTQPEAELGTPQLLCHIKSSSTTSPCWLLFPMKDLAIHGSIPVLSSQKTKHRTS